jgi:hypothetical protein
VELTVSNDTLEHFRELKQCVNCVHRELFCYSGSIRDYREGFSLPRTDVLWRIKLCAQGIHPRLRTTGRRGPPLLHLDKRTCRSLNRSGEGSINATPTGLGKAVSMLLHQVWGRQYQCCSNRSGEGSINAAPTGLGKAVLMLLQQVWGRQY